MCELLDPFFDVTPASVLFDHLRFSAYVVMIREWGRGAFTVMPASERESPFKHFDVNYNNN